MSSNRFVRILPWVLLAVLVLSWIPAILYDPQSDQITGPSDWVWVAGFLAFPLVGVFLARRFPQNAIGWLFIAGPTLVGIGVSLMEYSEAEDIALAGAYGSTSFGMGLIAIAAALLLFPDGKYPNRLFAAIHIGLLVALVVVTSEAVDGVLLFATNVLSVVALIFRAITGDQALRRQMVPPLLVLGFGVATLFAAGPLLPDTSVSSPDEIGSWVAWAEVGLFMILSVGIPISIAVSIAKYRLYEVDRIVSRTISYSVVVLLLGLVFAATAVWIPQVLGVDDPLFVAGATLVVAALFNPVRRRVQSSVDRRFNRSKYDAERVVNEFSSTLQDQTNSDNLVSGWVDVVSETMEPAAVSVWVRGS